MRWFEQPEILTYLVECYAGVEHDGRVPERQFIWEDPASGDVLLGNARAFSDHCAVKFNLPPASHRWIQIHEALRALGEVAGSNAGSHRTLVHARKGKNQEPRVRVIKRKASS